jgi:hypothetical protein
MTPPIILTGMHRSGTSLVASLLQRLGIDMGQRLIQADFRNPRGYHEDADFVELQRQMVQRDLPSDDGGFPDWGWTESESAPSGSQGEYQPIAAALLAARGHDGRNWGWKDPRTTLLLDFWNETSKDVLGSPPRFVLVYRFPWEVTDSVQRLADAALLRHPSYGHRIWTFYNRRLLNFYRQHSERCLLISTNALLSAVDRLSPLLNDKLGIRVAPPQGGLEPLVSADLFVSPVECEAEVAFASQAYPETLVLLRELDEAADMPATGLWPSDVTFPPASMPEEYARLFLARILETGRERAVLECELAGLRQHLRILSEHVGIRGIMLRAKRRMIGWCRFGSHRTTGRQKGDES